MEISGLLQDLYGRIAPLSREAVHELDAEGLNYRPTPESNHPWYPIHGRMKYGKRNSGMTWNPIRDHVCARTYGVRRRRIRRHPNIATSMEYASE